MKRLLMLLSVPTMILVAAPAYADPPSDNDAAFLKELSDSGVSFQDATNTVTVAKDVCDLLDKGTSEADIQKNLGSQNPSLTKNDGAKKFMLLAANSYCPKYLPNDDGSAKSVPKSS